MLTFVNAEGMTNCTRIYRLECIAFTCESENPNVDFKRSSGTLKIPGVRCGTKGSGFVLVVDFIKLPPVFIFSSLNQIAIAMNINMKIAVELQYAFKYFRLALHGRI